MNSRIRLAAIARELLRALDRLKRRRAILSMSCRYAVYAAVFADGIGGALFNEAQIWP